MCILVLCSSSCQAPTLQGLLQLSAQIVRPRVDLKGWARPPYFNGTESDWPEFKSRLENLASLFDLEELLTQAGAYGGSIVFDDLTSDERANTKFLYSLLVQVCAGRAMKLIRLVPRHDGFSAWQRLVQEYEPQLLSRHCAMLAGILSPLSLNNSQK